jgi:hypothetical protein
LTANASQLFTTTFATQLDDLLFEVTEELQLSPARYAQAEQRYLAVAQILEADSSPFSGFAPRIYPQGSMRLGTTVKPIKGDHDLDFVLELSQPHHQIDPMKLISALHSHFKGHGLYQGMVELKNRCVRLVYANEFYMDILPACKDQSGEEHHIQVPDREARSWKPSNPIGYASWFEAQSHLGPDLLLEKAMPLPKPQPAGEKRPLQLIVQLIKRWRDLRYAADMKRAPISIILTTLAADVYRGQRSVSEGLGDVLLGIVRAIDYAEAHGHRLYVLNPKNPREDLSERWDTVPEVYDAFKGGIREFATQWSALMRQEGNVQKELEGLFGETVRLAKVRQAERLQKFREAGALGVTQSGRITGAGAVASTIVCANTFHGR